MVAANKVKESRKASAMESKPAAKGAKKQKVEEKVVEEEDEDDDDDDEDEEDAEDDDDDDDEEEDDEDEEEEEAAPPAKAGKAAKVEEPAEEEEEDAKDGNGFEDETLECKDCGNEFVFTSGEQEFYQQKVSLHKKTNSETCLITTKEHPSWVCTNQHVF
jgi:Probable zinc-ribbon domain